MTSYWEPADSERFGGGDAFTHSLELQDQRDGVFGIYVPQDACHSIEVHEASTFFEAKDGAYVVGM